MTYRPLILKAWYSISRQGDALVANSSLPVYSRLNYHWTG
jgi:hypothetical protein